MNDNNFKELMKNMNFVEDVDYYTRKFTRIYVISDELYIGHTISNIKTKFKLEDIDLWINYYDRI